MTIKTKIYFIPGLGFDDRVIANLVKNGLEIETINWNIPEVDETITSYAQRMSEKIDTTYPHITLMGHSFGGIMAQEISQIIHVDQIILISTGKSRDELSLMLKSIAPLGIHKLLRKRLILKTFPFWAKPYGYTNEDEVTIFKSMIADNDNRYLNWALKHISKWDKDYTCKTPIIHIHGDADKTFPIKMINHVSHVIKGGTHFMIFNRAKEIAAIIKKYVAIEQSVSS